jgi:hypothetical protein
MRLHARRGLWDDAYLQEVTALWQDRHGYEQFM